MTPADPLHDPVMIAAFEGWNDAGDAASQAVEHLALTWDARPYAELDPERFYDFQVARPVITIAGGVARGLAWPTTRLSAVRRPGASHDVVLVHGIEPSFGWRSYCEELTAIAERAEVTQVVILGSLLADVAHTTPIQVTGVAHDESAAERLGLTESTYEGVTGINGALHSAMIDVGIPSVALWAAVPHYVAEPPSPKVTVALLRMTEEVLDIEIPLGDLPGEADTWVEQVTALAAQDDEIGDYIKSLQERDDAAITMEPTSGEMLAEEFQRYLRRRHPKPGASR